MGLQATGSSEVVSAYGMGIITKWTLRSFPNEIIIRSYDSLENEKAGENEKQTNTATKARTWFQWWELVGQTLQMHSFASESSITRQVYYQEGQDTYVSGELKIFLLSGSTVYFIHAL